MYSWNYMCREHDPFFIRGYLCSHRLFGIHVTHFSKNIKCGSHVSIATNVTNRKFSANADGVDVFSNT